MKKFFNIGFVVALCVALSVTLNACAKPKTDEDDFSKITVTAGTYNIVDGWVYNDPNNLGTSGINNNATIVIGADNIISFNSVGNFAFQSSTGDHWIKYKCVFTSETEFKIQNASAVDQTWRDYSPASAQGFDYLYGKFKYDADAGTITISLIKTETGNPLKIATSTATFKK